MIVVTGAAGFIGSNLVRALNQMGEDDVVAVDDLSDGSKFRNIATLKLSDYVDKDDLPSALGRLKKPDAVFHQGACSSTTEPDGKYMMANNFEYSKMLLDYCQVQRVPLIYASSAAVYGSGAKGFREDPECECPLNVYAYSKLAFDNRVRAVLGDVTTPVVGLRYFNAYGPQENHKAAMTSVAWQLFHQHKAGEPFELFEGSAEFLRDFVYVDDCVAANLHFLRSSASGIFNVGTGRARSFEDLARIAIRALGGGSIKYVPFPDQLAGKYQRFTEADLTRLRSTGYARPFQPLESGVSEYFRVLRESDGYYGC
jgi:ADP-L-glycero-D-manno-heptose 6-epimerase